MQVFVTGATGLVGRALCAALVRKGHSLTALSRSAVAPGHLPQVKWVQGDPAVPGPWQESLAACDGCVNLAGEPIASGRWTHERKEAIRRSRVQATQNVAAVISQRGPSVLVNGSAIGYYGPHGDELLDESSANGSDFLAGVARDWEAAALPARRRARLVLLRTGLVLAPAGGALERLALPFRLGVGGPIGTGAFWHSWIHLADEVGLIAYALEGPQVEGPLNATAPEPVRNRELARAVGTALHRSSWLPIPPLVLKLALGELAEVVTAGQRVVPRKAQQLGYPFRFERLEAALADLLQSDHGQH